MSAPWIAASGSATASNSDAEQRAHGGGEGVAILRVRTEATDGLDVADGASRRELRAGLPARAEDANGLRVFAGEILDAEPVGCADPHALHHAVGQNRQRLAGRHRKQQDQSDIAIVRRRRDLLAAHVVAPLRPSDDVGIDANRAHAELRNHSVHGLEAIERIRSCRRREAVGTRAGDPASFRQFDIGLFHDLDAFRHGQDFIDVFVGQDQGHERSAPRGCRNIADIRAAGCRVPALLRRDEGA